MILDITLDEQAIDKAIQQLEEYERQLNQRVEQLLRALTDTGLAIAKAQVTRLDAIETGDLLSGLAGVFYPDEGVGIIQAGAPYAIFVEFGTGIAGARAPSEQASALGWQYDVNGHGDKGWYYFDDKKGRVRWTKGQKPRPFMHNTAEELRRWVVSTAKGVFSGD